MRARNPRSARIAALLIAGVALTGCSGGNANTAGSPTGGGTTPPIPTFPTPDPETLPDCQFPREIDTPPWVPDDLPLPDGTYATQRLAPASGFDRGLFVVPGTLQDLAIFILDEWPAAGWILGRGDSEPGEIDQQFSKSPAVGAMKAQAVVCNPGYSLVFLIYAGERSEVSPVPSISPVPT